jgi:flagellar basal-body rod modification protein FlgD
MLMTQMQNQDPTSPMDTNQFTTELVQFTIVQQQIQTNDSLTQLINLTQGSSMIQGSSMVGKQVAVTSNQLSLQNGTAGLQIDAPTAETVNVAITSDTGSPLRTATLSVNKGMNSWTWNGADNNGNQLPDGAYNVAVTANGASAGNVSVPFNVVGTATGISKSGTALKLNMGALSVDFSSVQSVLNGS